ncbi:MAG: EAL domain-containing protein [Sterolibacterium sp.]|nr:EAL domain-containing protein [Sterolibacterium sp.]
MPTRTATTSPAGNTTDDNTRRLKLLIATASAEATRQLLIHLQQNGFVPETTHLHTLEDLKNHLPSQRWDLMLLDPQLAKLDLLAALTIRQAQASDLPCLIIAEQIEETLALAAMQAGASDFIETRHDLKRLIPAIQRELQAAEARQQRQQARDAARQAMEAQLVAVSRFRRLTEAIPECVWIFDLDTRRMSFVSSAYERIWGRHIQDLLDDRKDWLRHIHPDDQLRLKQARNAAKLGGLDEEFRVIRPNGEIRWLRLITFPIRDLIDRVQSIGGVATDITNFIKQRDQLSVALAEQHHRAEIQKLILDALPADIALLDSNGYIIETNASWEQSTVQKGMLQYATGANYLQVCEELARQQKEDLRRSFEDMLAAVRGILAGGYETASRIYPSTIDDQKRWFRNTVAPLHTQEKRGAVVMHVEITESMLAEQRLLELSHYDSLTMLPNRLLFRDRLTTALTMARRNRSNLAVCFIDLDRFKSINESLGHTIGDLLLLEVARRLQDCVRDSDTVCRLGGDEFALLLPEMADQQDSIIVAERIIESLGAPCLIEGHELFVTASIGITLYPNDADDPDVLLRNADAAMYRAKEEGRNNYQFFTIEMNANAVEKMKLERDLRYALDNEEFVLHYQPKVSCQTGRIVGFEALLRWQHPQRGMVSPFEFIPLLEETGLIVAVGAWVLQTACHQAQTWRQAGLGALNMAVNVSGKQVNPLLHDTVLEALTASALPADQLELELTESQLMKDAEGIITTLQQLKDTGLHISVDDFGTGYSSLAYLKRFPIDTLKIDRAFVRDLADDANDVSIAKAIITLAHSFNLKVVAEGVETEDQLALLAANHCDIIQGFYFSRPLPASEATAMLQQNRCLPGHLLGH